MHEQKQEREVISRFLILFLLPCVYVYAWRIQSPKGMFTEKWEWVVRGVCSWLCSTDSRSNFFLCGMNAMILLYPRFANFLLIWWTVSFFGRCNLERQRRPGEARTGSWRDLITQTYRWNYAIYLLESQLIRWSIKIMKNVEIMNFESLIQHAWNQC